MPPTELNPSLSHLSRRRFLQASAMTLASSTLSSCGWTLGNVRQTTGPSDKLYIYSWSNYTDNNLLNSFSEQTGIPVVADVYSSNEEMLAKIQAGGGAAYSIIFPSDYMVRKMADLGLIAEMDFSQIEGSDRLFERFQNPVYDPGNKYSIPVSWGTTGLIYNTKKISQPPDDWNYLWENQKVLAKRMTLFNDVREVMGATLKKLGYSYNSTNPEEIKQAYESLATLKPAIASFTSDGWRQQIVVGDLIMAMSYSSDANEVIKENADLKYVIPKNGTSLWTDTMVIPKFAPKLEWAYKWINFILQPSIGAQISERLSFATPNQEAFKLLPSELQNNTNLFPPNPLIGKCEGIAPLSKDIEEIYDRYWTKLTSG